MTALPAEIILCEGQYLAFLSTDLFILFICCNCIIGLSSRVANCLLGGRTVLGQYCEYFLGYSDYSEYILSYSEYCEYILTYSEYSEHILAYSECSEHILAYSEYSEH